MNGEYSMNNLNGYYNDGRHEYEYNDHKHQSDYPPIAMLFIILFCSLSLNLFRCLITEDDQEEQLNIPLTLEKKEIEDEKLFNETCVICLDNFQKKDKISTLQCEHSFHYNCLSLWIKDKNSCPLCRLTLL